MDVALPMGFKKLGKIVRGIEKMMSYLGHVEFDCL